MVSVELNMSVLRGDSSDDMVLVEFSEKELELLGRFVALVDRIRGTRLLKNGMPHISSINWDENNGLRFQCPQYEDSDLYELLHCLRPVILPRETASFQKIASIIGKKFTDRELRSDLRVLRTVFNSGEFNLFMQFKIGDKSLFDEDTLKLWLNGKQYHNDEDKAATWEDLEDSLGHENARAYTITQLCDKVKALFILQSLTKMILAKCTQAESGQVPDGLPSIDHTRTPGGVDKEKP